MNTPKINGIIRHILTVVGTVLVAFGVISEEIVSEGIELVMAAVGSITLVVAFIKSIFAPEKNITDAQYQALTAKK